MSVYGLWSTTQSQAKRPVSTLIISDTDANGVLLAAARARVLKTGSNSSVGVVSRFGFDWGTRPNADLLAKAFEKILEVFDAPRTELIDLAVDNDHPEAWVSAVAEYAVRSRSLVFVYDVHPSTKRFARMLLDRGVMVVPPANNAELALVLGLLDGDAQTRMLALASIVADRDPSVLQFVKRSEVEGDGWLLKLANTADVIVRNTKLVEGEPSTIQYLGDQGRVAAVLAENPALLNELADRVEYPPARLVHEAVTILQETPSALLVEVDGDRAAAWIPKTLERVAMMHEKDAVVAIVRGFDRRSGKRYWDVQLLRYWLSDTYTNEDVQRVIAKIAIEADATVRLSGGYGSVRFYDESVAKRMAKKALDELEGATSTTARMLAEPYVARLVRSDYRKLYRLLAECLEEKKSRG